MRAELKRDLEKAGLLDFHPVATYVKTAFLLVLTAALLVGYFLVPYWWLKAPLFFAGVCTNVGLIMIGHESGHGSISPKAAVNDFPGYLLFSYLAGLSFNYWRYKHNQHHAHCNVDGRDPDIQIFPFAWNAKERSNTFGFKWLVHRYQGLTFWVLTTFTSFAIRYDALHFTFGPGRKMGRASERLLDRACLAGHYFTWLVVPVVFFHASILSVVLFYTAWGVVAGVLMAAIFIPAHTPFPIYSAYSDNTALQLETTQNLKTNWLFSYLLIGLDQQVEHHLFPRMSHMNMRAASPIVREHCKQAGLPYSEEGWGAALWTSTKMIHRLPYYEPAPQADGARPHAVRSVEAHAGLELPGLAEFAES